MIYLLLSILASSLLFVIFKSFKAYKINTFQAITVNYFTACLVGLISYKSAFTIDSIINALWFKGAFCLGFIFISVFNIMALTSQKNGVATASIASKMSVVMPIIFGVLVYNETLNALKITGIILALIAVYFSAYKKSTHTNSASLILPAFLFLGSGIIDASLKYIETNYVPKNEVSIFTATIFFIAGCIGLIVLGIKKISKQHIKLTLNTLISGLCLGVINYFSMYYLLKALQIQGLESSTVFTLNNVAIVMLTALLGLLIFKEKLSAKNWFGVGLAIIAIVLVSLF